MKPLRSGVFGVSDRSFLLRFCAFHNSFLLLLGQGSRFAVTFAVEHDAIGAIAQSIDGGRAEQFVGEGGAPFVEIEIAGDEWRLRS